MASPKTARIAKTSKQISELASKFQEVSAIVFVAWMRGCSQEDAAKWLNGRTTPEDIFERFRAMPMFTDPKTELARLPEPVQRQAAERVFLNTLGVYLLDSPAIRKAYTPLAFKEAVRLEKLRASNAEKPTVRDELVRELIPQAKSYADLNRKFNKRFDPLGPGVDVNTTKADVHRLNLTLPWRK